MKWKRLLTFLLFSAVLFCFAIASLPYFRGNDMQSEGLELHFIDVGQGDASLVLCDGHAMLIDGGTPGSSRTIYTYLQQHKIDHLDYIVASHAHDDHVGGLAGALNAAKADHALSPVTQADGRAFQSFLKYLDQQGVSITVPAPGDTFSLGSASFQILGPIRDTTNVNDTSLVIRLTYGSFHALFTGDAGTQEEQDILQSRASLRSDVLKVGHHGSADASGEAWLQAVRPKTAVISCGVNNEYGHPASQTVSRLEAIGTEILRTDQMGDIVIRAAQDGSYALADNALTPQSDESVSFIVNTRTGKFHDPNCPSVRDIMPQNRLEFSGDRESLLEKGYTPCGRCQP